MAFGKDLDFDAVCWAVGAAKATSSRLHHRLWFTEQKGDDEPGKAAGQRTSMPDEFAIFLKCVIRLSEERALSVADQEGGGLSSSERDSVLRAGRYLLMAMQERGEIHPCNMKSADFTRADQLASVLIGWTPYNVGSHLQKLGKIVSLYRLTTSPIRFSTSAVPPDPEMRDRKEAAELLPSEEALDALRQISRKELSVPDIVRMAALKIKRCAPMRINEILTLPEDCEIVIVDSLPGRIEDLDDPKGRDVYYGIRYFEEKTGTWQEQYFPSDLVPIVRRSIAEVRLISATSREIAGHYATHPNVAWLPDDFPCGKIVPVDLAAKAFWMTPTQINGFLARRGIEVIPNHVMADDLRAGLECERQPRRESRQFLLAAVRKFLLANEGRDYFAVAELSEVLDVIDTYKWLRQHDVEVKPRSIRRTDIDSSILRDGAKTEALPQPLEKCLFVFPQNFFRDAQSFLPRVAMLTTDQIRIFLGGSETVKSIFDRYGFHREHEADSKKKRLKMTTSMLRRLHITKGREAGLSPEEIRDWVGHDTIGPQETYNCKPAEDTALDAGDLDDDWVAPHKEFEEVQL